MTKLQQIKALTAAVAMLTAGSSLHAASSAWIVSTAGVGDGTWGTAANWTPATVPTLALGSDVTFNNTGVNNATSENIGLEANQGAHSLTFSETGPVALRASNTGGATTARTFTLDTGGITVLSGSGADTLSSTNGGVNLVLNGSQTWSNNSSSLFQANWGTTGLATAGNTTTLTLASSGTGGTNLLAAIGNGAAGGNVALVYNTTAGTTTVSGANTYTGGTTLTAGNVTLGNAAGLGANTAALTVNGGLLNLANLSPTVGSLSGIGGTISSGTAGTATLTVGNASTASTAFGGALVTGTGQVALTKVGTGTLTLTGLNTSTGATTLQSGGVLVDLTTATMGIGAVSLGGNTSALFSTPTLTIQGNAAAVTSATTLGNLTIGTTDSVLNINANGGLGTTLTLGNTWTRASGAGYLALSLSAGATLTSAPTLQGSIVPSAIVGGTDFATVATGKVVAYSAYTPYVTATAPTSATASNLKVDNTSIDPTAFAAGTTSLNSVLVNDSTARTLDVGTGNTLNLGVTGTIFTPHRHRSPHHWRCRHSRHPQRRRHHRQRRRRTALH